MVKSAPVLLLCLLGAVLGAAEGDAKAQARALYADATRSLDIWTMLQLEAWSERSGARIRSVLPGIEVIGDPLFATPFAISRLHNLPDKVVVTSRDRVYQWANDGRPLSLSWQLPDWPWEDTVEPGGKAFGMSCRRDHPDNQDVRYFSVAGLNLEDGAVRSRVEIEGPSGDRAGPVAVASDASAVAAELRGSSYRILVAVGDQRRILGGWRRPIAIGRNGGWLIGHNPENQRTLITKDEKSHQLRDSASGPGTAAVLIKDQVALVKDDGSLAPLDLPLAIGKDAAVTTVGAWLVVYSGTGAASKPTIDVLGNLSGGGQPQPPTCALYRWREVIANPAATPVEVAPFPLVVAESQAAALYRWRGPALELVDLSGDEIQARPFVTAPADIAWVEDSFQVTTVTLAGDKRWLLDPTGAELLVPTPGWLMVQSRTWALRREGDTGKQTYKAIYLSADAAKRSTTGLQIEPGEWNVVIPAAADQAFAWHNDEVWRRVDPYTGKVVAQGDASNRPGVDRTHDPRGRFYARGPRAFAKSDPPATRQWSAFDAWRNGRAYFILDHERRVWASGRKRGEWLDLGEVPGGARFARVANDLTVVNGDNQPLATIAAAGRLEAPRSGPVSDLPPGLWQVRDFQFVPPRAGNQVWNEATGLRPDFIRCPDGDGLLVPLGSVLLNLDPAAGKILGRPR